MPTISELMYAHYKVRREVSQTADLATLLLARLEYEIPSRLPAGVVEIVQRIERGPLERVSGRRSAEFARWLSDYLAINRTKRGVSFYPLHPILTLPGNGEGSRVEGFIAALAGCFTPEESERLRQALWSPEALPPFERVLHSLVEWQLPDEPIVAPAAAESFVGCDGQAPALTPAGILARTKEDLLALATATSGVQTFTTHAGRLLAFALSRHLLAAAGVTDRLPIYAAPAADTHEGVKTLAHGIIEVHRAQFAQALEKQFRSHLRDALRERGMGRNPPDEAAAQEVTRAVFHNNANVVPRGRYESLLQEHGSFEDMGYAYYWSRSGAVNRFLRQLHGSHLSLAKKAGLANSRSRYSRWHFYWLAPTLVETLLLASQTRLERDRVLLTDLLDDWRQRYGIAVMIGPDWEGEFRRCFHGVGSPESLNETNRRRLTEILAERGRLHKDSDDFPWVLLKG